MREFLNENQQKEFITEWLMCIDGKEHCVNKIFEDGFNHDTFVKEITKILYGTMVDDRSFDKFVILGDGNNVKVISGDKTSNETLETILSLCKFLNKTPVPSEEAPGFIVNRLLWQFLNESYKLLEAGIAERDDIDKAIKLGLNHPMGPFELSDYIGLDILLEIGEYIKCQLGEQYEPAQLLREMVENGTLGRKTSKGFYEY